MVECNDKNIIEYGKWNDFYTTWSTFGLSIAAILQLLLLVVSKSTTKPSVFLTICKSIVVAFIGNTIAVSILSQCLYSYNRKAYQTKDHKECSSISMGVLQQALKRNFMWHIVPLVVALVMCAVNLYIDSPKINIGYRLMINIITISLFMMAWFSVPSSHGKKGISKINDVYCKPKVWLAALYIGGLLTSFVLLNLRTFKSPKK